MATVDLNSASAEEIAQAVPQVGEKRVSDLVDRRPFQNWDEVRRIPGFDDGMIKNMQQSGLSLEG